MAKPDTSFKVRMPSDLKDRVEAAARASNRSMNAEIVARLRTSFAEERPKGSIPAEEFESLFSSFLRSMARLPPGTLRTMLEEARSEPWAEEDRGDEPG